MTVKTITTSYFRTHLSQCVREARSGVVFIITYRGKPISGGGGPGLNYYLDTSALVKRYVWERGSEVMQIPDDLTPFLAP